MTKHYNNSKFLMPKAQSFFIALYSIILPMQAHAFKFTPKICQEYGLGKNWYCNGIEEIEPQEITANDILNSALSPEQKAIQLNELWESQRKTAAITESESDIIKFLDTHNLITTKGVNFSRNVQKILESNAKYSNPQSYYKNISDEALKFAERQEVLSKCNKRYGLVFVYNSECPYCLRQLPIIIKLKEVYKLKVLGVSVDGKRYLNNLDENITDSSILNDPIIQSLPTILLLDKLVPGKIFISHGLTTLDEIEERIVNRINEREANDEKNN